MTNESISKRLIDEAQTMMVVYYATFSAPGAMIKEFNTSYANFCKLAEEVEARLEKAELWDKGINSTLLNRNNNLEERESLWVQLAKEYAVYIPPTIEIVRLRKELGLDD